MIERKKLKSLISFHSANKTGNYNGGGGKEGKKEKERTSKRTTEQVKT